MSAHLAKCRACQARLAGLYREVTEVKKSLDQAAASGGETYLYESADSRSETTPKPPSATVEKPSAKTAAAVPQRGTSRRRLIGMGIALLGILVSVAPATSGKGIERPELKPAALLCLGTGLALLAGAKLRRGYSDSARAHRRSPLALWASASTVFPILALWRVGPAFPWFVAAALCYVTWLTDSRDADETAMPQEKITEKQDTTHAAEGRKRRSL